MVTEGDAGGFAYDGTIHHAPGIPADTLDPVGSGDSFAAGFIVGYWEGGVEKGLSWGTALAALKRTYRGDLAWGNREDIEGLIEGAARGVMR